MKTKIVNSGVLNFDMKKIGKVLKCKRRGCDITQDYMAFLTGRTKNHLSSVERGIYEPSAIKLLIYMMVCGISVDELLDKNELKVLSSIRKE